MEEIKIGIVGAGVMGGELAYVVTQAGMRAVMKDVGVEFFDAGVARCRQVYEFKVKRRRMTQEDMDARMSLLEGTLDYGPLADAAVVIEAVPEILEVKQKVFRELDEVCGPDALLASNTSALSIAKIGELASRRERVLGMHFFNPPSMMSLVEIIRTPETSEIAARGAAEIVLRMGKTPVVCADSAGFIVNRLLCAAMLEAVRCEREGLADRRDIDSFLVKPEAGLPIGLFKMADQLGLDLLLKVMRILEGAFGERMSPPEEIVTLHAAGKTGVRAGSGFYDYSDPAGGKPSGSQDNRELIIERVLCAVVAEAQLLVSEEVAAPEDVDAAMRNGALFKKPPFAYQEERGGAGALDARIAELGLRK